MKGINKYSLEQYVFLLTCAKLTCVYGPMYLKLYEYPPYSDKQPEFFETNIIDKLICSNVNRNYVAHNILITWVSKNSWDMFFSEFT